ncbi:short chain dehydrogenase [Pyrenochaeta sp. DS3sAY3a]|nr:short chain dehydrogenase [Pyrenochaeta sp. DS3sAY3a]
MSAQALKHKVFAITGGASGIGLATAKVLSERGGTVCLSDVDSTALSKAESFFQERNLPFSTTTVDVSKRDQVEAWIHSILEKFGRLDGAANVAGVIGKDHGKKSVAELDDNEWNKIIAVNLTGCMNCLRAELNHISPRGSIVNVASIHGTTGLANNGAYAASKHGVIGLTRVAAKENGAREVRVNAVAPGSIHTPMMQQFWDETKRPADAPFDDPTAFQRQGTAAEVANLIAFLLGPESSFISGSVYAIDGAWL